MKPVKFLMVLMVVPAVCAWALAGCGGDGESCTPQVSITCVNGKTYWLDSCNQPGEVKEECECGCRADGAGCETCDCQPDCFGKECGDDGCTGTCGFCSGGKICRNNLCICESHASTSCHNGDVWWFDSCGNPEVLKTDCESGCSDGQCSSCTPDCTGRVCGPDPACGASCGDCGDGEACVDGQCSSCTPDCTGRVCGPDPVCGASCGNCDGGQTCVDGQCTSCTPDCSGLDCGPDPVCGASCGGCTGGMVCEQGTCQCQPEASTDCHNGDVWWFDSCGNPQEPRQACQDGCADGECTGCTPACQGKECGADGCGGSCGQCTEEGEACDDNNMCVCQDHATVDCHNDDVWWFDSCGNPEELRTDCTSGCTAGQCNACEGDCTGKECGDDGCGGSCGDCTGGEVCVNNDCICEPHANSGCYQDDVYWYDSCGNVEDMKEDCAHTCADGACQACSPDCAGKECGDDGCGGSCGDCAGGQECQSDGTCACTPHASSDCYQDDVWWFDSCGTREDMKTDCQYGCAAGQCTSCTPDCTGKECGDDGCGGNCGVCDPMTCNDTTFQCECSEHSQCGATDICIQGDCDYAYGRQYRLEVHDIFVALRKLNGDQWDGWPDYDPDVRVCFFKDIDVPPDQPLTDSNKVFCTSEKGTEEQDIGGESYWYADWDDGSGNFEGFEIVLQADDQWLVAVYDMDFGSHDKIDYFDIGPIPVDWIKAAGVLLNGLSSSTLITVVPM